MIVRAYALLKEDLALCAQEQKSARFILVDEFQDANFAQVKILQTIAGEEQNVFAVGDPDQSVYRFRGASSAAFGLFQRSFPNSKLIVLGKNRRSTGTILHSAFALINLSMASGCLVSNSFRIRCFSGRALAWYRLATASISSRRVATFKCLLMGLPSSSNSAG